MRKVKVSIKLKIDTELSIAEIERMFKDVIEGDVYGVSKIEVTAKDLRMLTEKK